MRGQESFARGPALPAATHQHWGFPDKWRMQIISVIITLLLPRS